VRKKKKGKQKKSRKFEDSMIGQREKNRMKTSAKKERIMTGAE
jgi:hypothetical protein